MQKQTTKQKKSVRRGLFTGVMLLTAANIIVKLLGFFYKVPLNAALGDEMANVNSAYAIYALLYTVSTAGVPNAISLSVSRARAAADEARALRILRVAVAALFSGGTLLSLLLLLFARPIALLNSGGDSYLCLNNSGRAVKQLMSKYKIDEDKLLVIYDDYDLPKGAVRIRPSGSAGTHNGMRSIIGETGMKNFTRIRIGIKDENLTEIPIVNYVLSRIRSADDELFYQAFDRASDAAKALAGGLSVELTMTKYNG